LLYDGLGNWIVIPAATGATYDPPAGHAATRTYACRLVPVLGESEWVFGSHVVFVDPPFERGTVTPKTQLISQGSTPSPLNIPDATPGMPKTSFEWFFKEGLIPAPTGTSTAGWTSSGVKHPDLVPPALGGSRSYACFVTPIAPFCGTAAWAKGNTQITVVQPFSLGQLAAINQVDNQVVCNSTGDGSVITFGTAPTGAPSFSYQWYSQTAVVPAPTGNATAGCAGA